MSRLYCLAGLRLLLAVTLLSPSAWAAPLHADGEPFEGDGEFGVAIADGPQAQQVYRYTLNSGPGRLLELELLDTPSQDLKTGDSVHVRGAWRQRGTAADRVVVTELIKNHSALTLRSATASTIRSLIVIGIDVADGPLPCEDAAIKDMVWTGAKNIRGLYETASFGKQSFTSDRDKDGTLDYFRVTVPSSLTGACNVYGWMAQADSALLARGINTNSWQHKLYMMPNDGCSFAGEGSIGCAGSCYALSVICGLPDVAAHELGHNLGLMHAGTDTNNDGVADSEYADSSSIMGIGGVGWRQFTAPAKSYLSWVPEDRTKLIYSNASVNLFSLDNDPLSQKTPPLSNTQIAKVGIPGVTTLYGQYYLSLRTPDPIYSVNLPTASIKTVQVHRTTGSNSLLVSSLSQGQSFTDGAGVKISVASVKGNDAKVNVSYLGALPVKPTPTPKTYEITGKIVADGQRTPKLPRRYTGTVYVEAATGATKQPYQYVTTKSNGKFAMTARAGRYYFRAVYFGFPTPTKFTSRWTRISIPSGKPILVRFSYSRKP